MHITTRLVGPEDVEGHYESLWGIAQDRQAFRTKTSAFNVLTFSPDQTGEGVFLFATVGASQALGTADHSCEFFLGLSSAPSGIADSLAEVALDGNGTGEVPNFGDSTTLAFDLWSGTTARSYLFTGGGEAIVPTLKKDGAVIDFIQLVPVFPDELDYKSQHGENALWNVFEEKHTPYWNAERMSAL